MRTCQICGRRLRTKIKYCYYCKGRTRELSKKEFESIIWIIGVVGIIFVIIALFVTDDFLNTFGYVGAILGIPCLLIAVLRSLYPSKPKNK